VKLFYEVNLDQSHIYNNGFLQAFQQVAANIATPGPIPLSNPIVGLYGSGASAISALGASNFTNGAVGTVANTIDTSEYTAYVTAGLSQYYLRNFPQFQQLLRAW
jgi:hypothetical protein